LLARTMFSELSDELIVIGRSPGIGIIRIW
jgi:hypothetical protein